jgi:hypothetical protein
MANDIEGLRKHVFDTIEALKDPGNPIDIARAKIIKDLAQVVVNSAKVEVDFLRIQGGDGKGTGFIPEKQIEQKPGAQRLVNGVAQSGSK